MLLRKHRLTLGLLALAVVGIGCSKAWHGVIRDAPISLAPEAGITVILVQSPWGEYSHGLEERVVGCIRDALEDTHPTSRIVPPDEFRQVAFPDLTPEEIPAGHSYWEVLAEDAAFRERIAPLGLRYLIAVTATKGKGSPEFWGFGMAAPGMVSGGMFGAAWETWAVLETEVVDLTHARLRGKVWAKGAGKSSAGAIIVFPYYIPSFSERRACRDLGEGVAKLLAGEKRPEQMEAEQFEEVPAKAEEGAEPAVKDEEDHPGY